MSLKYFEIAKELNDKPGQDLKKRNLHFRGNVNSFSLVSLDPKTPEMGISGLKSISKGEKALLEIDDLLKDKISKIDAGKSRPTPEKQLQSWIIGFAMNHPMRHLPFGNSIQFITSELAFIDQELLDGGCGKVVNDILGFDPDGNIVIIELKSERALKELTRQVNQFEATIKNNVAFFEELVLMSTDVPWKDPSKIVKMIVWPSISAHAKSEWQKGIIEICYDPGYWFSKPDEFKHHEAK